MVSSFGNFCVLFYLKFRVALALAFLLSFQCYSQEKQSVLIKVFDTAQKPVGSVALSINGGAFIQMNERGSAVAEILSSDLPIKSIVFKEEKLEVASWNLSKGVLEIILREKNYTVVSFLLKFSDGKIVPPATVTYTGTKTLTVKSSSTGEFDLPISLQDKISSPGQFRVESYRVESIKESGSKYILTVSPPAVPLVAKVPQGSQNQELNLGVLDSIRSLTMFYSVFKDISIGQLNDETRAKVDAKFNSLVKQMQDSIARTQKLMGNISDSSFVIEDIKNLVDYATLEGESLQSNREDFQRTIDVISSKLEKGIRNFNETERLTLLRDLDLLEKLLIENEGKFYQNQSDYREIINALKQQYFDVQNLETKLSETEKQREEEQRVFRTRLILIGVVVLLFAVLIIVLLSFSSRLRKQKQALISANEEINSINENLEQIVIKRTELLENANIELDTLLYRASHDLRSPLRSILGLCNIHDHIPVQEYVGLVKTTTQHMDDQLKKLSTISEISAGSKSITTCNVNVILNEIQAAFKTQIEKYGIQFHIDCQDEVVLSTSESLLRNVLTSLIDNAIYFVSLKNSDQRRVEVTVSNTGTEVLLTVYDNGVGIQKDVVPKIFNMFYKGNEKSKGNGLGLYMALKSVTAMSGSISVESEAEIYSKFKVVLPG